MLISPEVEATWVVFVGNVLGFQPSGRSDIPLYKETPLQASRGLVFAEVREGMGPARVKARAMLKFFVLASGGIANNFCTFWGRTNEGLVMRCDGHSDVTTRICCCLDMQ
jgi:hypothetical protein